MAKEMKDFVICGAGKRGKEVYSFLKYLLESKGNGKIVRFIDSDSTLNDIDGVPVCLPEKLNDSTNLVYIITPEKKEIIEFYKSKLQGKEYIIYKNLRHIAEYFQLDLTTIQRELCAYWHVDNMDWYFNDAELEEKLSRFWGEDSDFRRLFNSLDLTNVIELACGRGRHVSKYLKLANHVTLVDILQKNIDYCKNRFKESDKISYYKNDGYDLSELPSNSYTALFCYDAMVHFEMLDINSYLLDIYRVLKCGGKVLLHHSNFDAFYDGSYLGDSLHGRTFMNYKIFAYLAIHAGFKIKEQKIINWENVSNLDGITLLEKPNN